MLTKKIIPVRLSIIAVSFAIFVALLMVETSGSLADINRLPVDETRIIYPDEWGVAGSAGLAYSSDLVQFFSLDLGQAPQSGRDSTTVVAFTPYEDLTASTALPTIVADASNFTFDDSANRLLLLSRDLSELVHVKIGDNGVLDVATETRFSIGAVGLQSAHGMAIDGAGTALFILDSTASQVVKLELETDLSQATFDKVALSPALDPANLRGIALNPTNRHLYLLNPNRQILYEISQSGDLLAEYDLSTLELRQPHALVFAPSADLTDNPQTMHLFIADGGPLEAQTSARSSPHAFPHDLYLSLLASESTGDGSQYPVSRIFEVSLDVDTALSVASVNAVALTLVQTMELSNMSLSGQDYPSPDPSGLEYITETATLWIADGEVEESVSGNPPVYWNGANLFGVALPTSIVVSPTLLYTGTIMTSIPNQIAEAVGIAYDPTNKHFFISNDDKKSVTVIDPGPDGIVNGAVDTVVSSFKTDVFGCMDPEGIDYDHVSGDLFIADGINSEIYRVNRGANGVFDGVPPAGDDVIVTQFDTAIALNFEDPESVFVNAAGNLILASNSEEDFIIEVTTSGVLVQSYDITAANADNPAGVVMAPSSTTPDSLSYYIADRGQDNNDDPTFNDGLLYEFAAPQGGGDMIFVGSTSGGKVSNVRFADEDILLYSGGAWNIYFDGSDVLPTSADVDVFSLLPDDSILLSFSADVTISGFGLVKEFDVVRFDPTSIGTNTAGTFDSYFVGSTADLTVAAEDIDAFTPLDDGRLVLSTFGNPVVPGISGTKDEDLLAYTPSTNTWQYYFDGSDVGLADAASEDVNGVWIDPANGDIYLTTLGLFTVNGLSGDADDIFICDPGSTGATTTCVYRSYWDGGESGFAGEVVDSIFILPESQQVSSAMMGVLRAEGHAGEGDDPNADLDEGADDVEELEQEYKLFLPLADN